MDNNFQEIYTTTVGGPENPCLALIDIGTKGRMEVIISGHCPDCDNTLKDCECNDKSLTT
ncbi:MAG: hypothetical protein PHQ95_03260 [Candidatus Gracilibacteria bacterium]|nr:hypothetical protein [Candidatus Gracilibacteria bacterium]